MWHQTTQKTASAQMQKLLNWIPIVHEASWLIDKLTDGWSCECKERASLMATIEYYTEARHTLIICQIVAHTEILYKAKKIHVLERLQYRNITCIHWISSTLVNTDGLPIRKCCPYLLLISLGLTMHATLWEQCLGYLAYFEVSNVSCCDMLSCSV